MNLLSTSNGSIDDDKELEDLEKLLAAAEEIENNSKISNTQPVLEKPSYQAENFDSSDDEEIKNFLERKYNEYGRNINKKLKEQSAERHDAEISRDIIQNSSRRPGNQSGSVPETNKPSTSFSKKTITSKQLVTPVKPVAESNVPIYLDPIFGLRIIRPLISSVFLQERMEGRTPISMATVAFHVQSGDLTKDWVIAGVITSKSPVKQTKKGDSFSIWKVSDLKGEIKTISLFLFRSAHKELWKTSPGTVIAILNPGVFDKRSESGDVACLSIDSAQKVMILGESKDFGTCKSRKKNGEPCTVLVNLTDCEYCVYHIKQEFVNMSRRSELQSATAGRGLQELRNKVLGKAEVFYGGKSYVAVPAKKSVKQTLKDEKRLAALSGSPSTSTKSSLLGITPKVVPSTFELDKRQQLKDSKRLELLNNSSNSNSSTPEVVKPQQFSFMQKAPILSRASFSIDIDFSKKKSDLAKIKAIEAIRKRPLKKTDPNFVKYRGTVAGKKRAIDELHDLDENEQKKRKIEEADRRSRIQRIIEATSSHTNLINSREREEQDKYFNKLEKKEALEKKMLNTYKVACKAVMCLQCKYTAFSASDRCKSEKHPLKVIDAEKRFFQCQDCGNRTVTVHKLPKVACKNCSGSRWKRAAMIRERTVHDGPALSIRGDEEKFMGSLSGSASLNLMVPEECS